MMKNKLQEYIYNAQCIGNVAPIEYMIPYPSMRSLIEGQNIKYSKQIIIENPRFTNSDYYTLIQKTANWLTNKNLKPKQRVIIPKLDFPQSEIFLFGVWHVGAIGVLCGDLTFNKVESIANAKRLTGKDFNLFDQISNVSDNFNPTYKPKLDDEALLTFEKEIGIRLSHYNLLVNANGVQKALMLKSKTRFFCYPNQDTVQWAIFKTILPIYCGSILDNSKPELTIGINKCDYKIRHDIENIKDFCPTDIGICSENSGVLSIGKNPIHLTEFKIEKNHLNIKGHSVMMGYLDNTLNKNRYKSNYLQIPL